MVVVPEPAVKGCCPFGAGAVDGAIGPAPEQGADEPFGFAVGLWAVGAGAEVADAQGVAGDGVDGGAIARAVIGEQSLGGDAVAGVEGNGAPEERHHGTRLLIA